MAQIYRLPPRPYQRAIVENTYKKDNLALWLEQGLGKTKVTLDTANFRYPESNGLVVVSRTTVVENWLFEELGKHLVVPYTANLYSTKNKNKIPPVKFLNGDRLQVLLINDGCLRTDHGMKYVKEFLVKFKCGFIIDESTLIKTPSTKLTKNVIKLGALADWKRVLCGEPAPQGPKDYFSQYKFLDPNILGVKTFTAYKNLFCEQKTIYMNGRQIQTPTRQFKPGAQEVFESRIKPFTIRLRSLSGCVRMMWRMTCQRSSISLSGTEWTARPKANMISYVKTSW